MDQHSDSIVPAPGPRIKTKSGPSLVWLIPLVAALIGGWLVVKTLIEKGAEITIVFKTAEGIEAGKTRIKYKEIEIGVVDSVHFSDDYSEIILKAEIAKEAETFLRRDTRFWVVRPQLSLRGASGLSTLLSGVYIELEPGQGAPHRYFEGLDEPPVVKADAPGKKIVLLAGKLGSIDSGSPIYYKGILAGEVLGYELGNDRKSIFIHAFIKAPFGEIVQSNTIFWNVSGMDVSVGADGISIRSESVQSLLFGGIAFDTPDFPERANEDMEGLVFTLHDSYESIKEKSYTRKIIFVLYFDGSIRGLSIGAPVELKGIKVGSVVDLRLEFSKQDSTFMIPVLIEIETERIIERQEQVDGESPSPYDIMNNLINSGLRARLQTGSLLTGKLFVELGIHPETPVKLVNKGGPYPELPTIPASIKQMTDSVKTILSKVEKVDLEKIGKELIVSLEGINSLMGEAQKLIEKPGTKDAMYDLKDSLQALKSILTKLDHSDSLEKTIGAGRDTLEKLRITLGLLDKVLMPDSPLQYNINRLTEELAEAARSIRSLLDLLERKPNSIIFGKKKSGEK